MLRAWWASSVHWIDRLKTMGEQPSKLACFLAELRRRTSPGGRGLRRCRLRGAAAQ